METWTRELAEGAPRAGGYLAPGKQPYRTLWGAKRKPSQPLGCVAIFVTSLCQYEYVDGLERIMAEHCDAVPNTRPLSDILLTPFQLPGAE